MRISDDRGNVIYSNSDIKYSPEKEDSSRRGARRRWELGLLMTVGIVAVLFFLSSNLTGFAIVGLDKNASNMAGLAIIVVVLIFIYLYFKKKK